MLRFLYFPGIDKFDPSGIDTDVYKYLHNLETELVEKKLALQSTDPNFTVEEAFLAGQLAIVSSLLVNSPLTME